MRLCGILTANNKLTAGLQVKVRFPHKVRPLGMSEDDIERFNKRISKIEATHKMIVSLGWKIGIPVAGCVVIAFVGWQTQANGMVVLEKRLISIEDKLDKIGDQGLSVRVKRNEQDIHELKVFVNTKHTSSDTTINEQNVSVRPDTLMDWYAQKLVDDRKKRGDDSGTTRYRNVNY